ncbi:hypothetical protein HY410_01890 [Candidatus Gottesmanbacteria bacterium]|nr:hypothetical protein [Candidatus Gottesmanbacteria bacterium]
MAAEETLKQLGKLVEDAVSVGSAEAPPPEIPPIAEAVEPPPKRSGLESLVEATKQQLEVVAEKFKQATSETAKRIVGDPEKTPLPRDARVLEVALELLNADEETVSDPKFLRPLAERLVSVAQESGVTSEAGREARRYLGHMVEVAPTLRDVALKASPEIRGGVDEVSAVDDVFQGEGDPLAGTPLEAELKKYKQLLRYDTGRRHDTHKISRYIDEIKEAAYKQGVPEEQVKDAVGRLQAVIEETIWIQEETSPERGVYMRWEEIKHHPGADPEHKGEKPFPFRSFRVGDLKLLREGSEGERQWFYEFTDKIYGFGKERAQPSLQDQYKWDEFEDYMKWKYGKNSASNLAEYQYHWAERSKHEYIVKGLLFQPGDIRDRIRSLRLMTGSDLDYYLKNFEHSNFAASLYEQTVMDLMAEKRTKYDEALRWLADPDPDEKIARDELYIKLKEKNSAVNPDGTIGALSAKDQKKMYEIKQKFDVVGEGVMLWDDDLQTYTETYLEIENIDKKLQELQAKGSAQTPDETKLRDELTAKREMKEKKWQEYRKSSEQIPEGEDRQTLEDLRGLSPVDIEVRKRLITYLEAEGIEYKPYQIRMALWAARQASIGSGHVVAIGAFQSIEPGRVPDSVLRRAGQNEELIKAYKEAHGKSVMRAPAFEDLQRFYNPEVFAHRFTMLEEMGERARRFLTLSHLKEKGYDWHKMKITQTKAWKELGREPGITEEDRLARATLETIEQDMGVSFTQLLGPKFFGGGGDFDATTWRLEKGVLDQVRQKYIELKKEYPDDARLDNLALGIQLITAGKDEQAKKRIVDRMMRRTPSKLFQIAPIQRNQLLRDKGISFDNEWKPYVQRALSMAELKISTDTDLAVKTIDFGNPADFDKYVVPYLQELRAKPDRFATYQSVIKDFQQVLTKERKGKEHKTMLEAIAEGKFPMTLSLSDFDWKDANFFQLGTVAMDRRGRDNEGMAAARDIMHDILYQTELLSPNDPLETLKKIKELEKTVNGYADRDVAEGVAKEVLRVFIEMNRNRAIHGKGLLDPVKLTQWIPFGELFMRHYAEADYRHLKDKDKWLKNLKDNKILNKITNGAWRNFAGMGIENWPHTVAEALSYSIRYTGAEGNVFDEIKIAEIIATAQDMGMFVKNTHFANELRKEFHATLGGRVWNIARKYWWVVPVATIALAATKAIEDEQKRHA